MNSPDSRVVPTADGGHGAFTWEASHVMTNTYRIRRGHVIHVTVSFGTATPEHCHAGLLDGFCRILDGAGAAQQTIVAEVGR